MKTITFALMLAFLTGSTFATVITVSNNNNSPGQYTSLQTAIDNATNGDTIYVHGSPNNYGNIILNRQLTLIGPGYNPQKDNPLTATINNLSIDSTPGIKGSSNSKILGLILAQIIYGSSTYAINNIQISFNRIVQLNLYFNPTSASGITVSQNAIDYIFSLRNINGLVLKNNVIYSSTPYFSGCTSVIIANNLFYYSAVSTATILQDYSTITNNIFLNTHPNTNFSTFNNNLIFNSGSDVLPYGNNTGSGNLNGQAPVFVNAPDYNGINLAYNYHLTTGSPGHNAGTDGTDVGPFGGINPLLNLTGTPPIPQVKIFNINNSVVLPNTPLNISVKAKKQ